MTEIRVDVDLAHPPERVWRALTEAHLVTEWLSTSRFLLTEDRRLTFRATALKGLDDLVEGRVVATESPHRLVMRWSSVNLHTTVTLTVRPVAGGSRLSLVQQGFLGPHGAMRRRLLQRSYVELFEGPFTATLGRLAASADTLVSLSPVSSAPAGESKRNDGRAYERVRRQARSSSAPGLSSPVRGASHPEVPAPAPSSAAPAPSSAAPAPSSADAGSVPFVPAAPPALPILPVFLPAPPAAAPVAGSGAPSGSGSVLSKLGRLARDGLRRLTRTDDGRSQTVAASTALLLLLAMTALLLGRATSPSPAGPPQVGGGEDTVSAQPQTRTSIRRLSPASSPDGVLPPVATAFPASAPVAGGPLTATYRTENPGLSGYEASITILNNGTSAASDWTVLITLPLLGLTVPRVTGAVMTQNGRQFAFTPVDATRTVAPGATVRFTFEVAGLGHPDTCTINGRPCSGVPG